MIKHWLSSLWCSHKSSHLFACPVHSVLAALWAEEEHLRAAALTVLCGTATWKWNWSSVWKPGGAELTLFPTTVILSYSASSPAVTVWFGSDIIRASLCLCLSVIWERCQKLFWHRQWKNKCKFYFVFLQLYSSIRAGQNFLGQRKGASVAWGCSSCSTSKTRCIQCAWEGLTESFIAENVRQPQWLPASLLYVGADRWEFVYICSAIHIWEWVLMEIGWRRKQEVGKKNFIIGKTCYIV